MARVADYLRSFRRRPVEAAFPLAPRRPQGTPNEVLLHIGPHKTGSTSIQQAAIANRVALRQAGIVYPRVFQEQIYAHHNFAILAAAGRTHPSMRFDGDCALGALNSARRDVFLSSEVFAEAPVRVQNACEMIESRVTVAFFVRERSAALLSRWQQQVKTGKTQLGFEEYCKSTRVDSGPTALYRQADFLSEVERCCDRLLLFDYDALAAAKADLLSEMITRWCAQTGVEPPVLRAPRRRSNVSMNTAETEAVRHAHLLNIAVGERLEPIRLMRRAQKAQREPRWFPGLTAALSAAASRVTETATAVPVAEVVPDDSGDEAEVRERFAESFGDALRGPVRRSTKSVYLSPEIGDEVAHLFEVLCAENPGGTQNPAL